MHTVSWKGGRFGWAAAPGTTWRLLAVRLGYRAVVLLGFALTSGVHPGIRPDVYPAILDAARFALGVGGACTWAGALAWLATSAPRERRGELLGVALGAAVAGALFGPLAGRGPDLGHHH